MPPGKEGKKMKYKTIDDLDARIEKTIKRSVKSYYTDWKHYDRPKYMGYKGSREMEDKRLFLIVRECGTWLERESDLYKDNWTTAVFEQYLDFSNVTYYTIDIDRLIFEKIENPTEYGKEAKRKAA